MGLRRHVARSTLFVDEGFGSLDADALDQAIAALDRLRHHGRQIGVITHVEAMKAALTVGIGAAAPRPRRLDDPSAGPRPLTDRPSVPEGVGEPRLPDSPDG